MNKLRLVAHRGFAARYPENSLAAMQAAVAAGARYLELDVQLSADQVPVIFHDAELLRTTGQPGRVYQQSWASLSSLSVAESARLGERFRTEKIPSLEQLVDWLGDQPDISLFVELKQESIDVFGAETVLDRVMAVLAPIQERCAIISFNSEVLALARTRYGQKIGWVIKDWNDDAKHRAERLRPDYLICNYQKITTALWPGDWQWFLYEITDPELALHWQARGVSFVETMDIVALLADPRLNQAGLHGL